MHAENLELFWKILKNCESGKALLLLELQILTVLETCQPFDFFIFQVNLITLCKCRREYIIDKGKGHTLSWVSLPMLYSALEPL